jgi:hypothetical protein
LETIEAMLMNTEVECFDLIDRIGNEFDIDTSLFLMQATHWRTGMSAPKTTTAAQGGSAKACRRS